MRLKREARLLLLRMRGGAVGKRLGRTLPLSGTGCALSHGATSHAQALRAPAPPGSKRRALGLAAVERLLRVFASSSLCVYSPLLKAQPLTSYPFSADNGCGQILIDPARLRGPQAGKNGS